MTTQELFAVYSTFGTQAEAISVARALLEKRLAACVNIQDGVLSIYRWEGAVQQEKEVAMVAKTTKEKLSETMALIKAMHSYELPCIVAYKIDEGFPPFLRWVAEETAS